MAPITKDVGLGGISVKGRLRALRPEAVKSLMESIAVNGLMHAIVLQPRTGGSGYWLLAGAHRLEAVRRLKRTSIKATILDGLDADRAQLIEIDENLIRAELSPAETAAHIGVRKAIYERIHPETRHGAVGRRGKKSSQAANSFAKDTAAKAGQHLATVSRAAARSKAIPNVAALARTSLDKGEELDALAKLPPPQQAALIKRAKAGEKVSAKTALKHHAREGREKTLATKIKALPQERYGVIYADPEWKFEVYSEETGSSRAAANHYPTSTLAEIKARDVSSIAAKDCVLFLWATAPMLPQALEVMAAWGFTYKTNLMWRKTRVGRGRGTGYWFTGEHEQLLVGTRGNVPAPATAIGPSVLEAPVGKHSEKPELFAEMIDSLPKPPEDRAERAQGAAELDGLGG